MILEFLGLEKFFDCILLGSDGGDLQNLCMYSFSGVVTYAPIMSDSWLF